MKAQQSRAQSSIFNFCQQHFELVHQDNVTVGELETFAEGHGDSPFIFYDGARGEAACIIPETIRWAKNEFELNASDIAADTGLFKILRRDQYKAIKAPPRTLFRISSRKPFKRIARAVLRCPVHSIRLQECLIRHRHAISWSCRSRAPSSRIA